MGLTDELRQAASEANRLKHELELEEILAKRERQTDLGRQNGLSALEGMPERLRLTAARGGTHHRIGQFPSGGGYAYQSAFEEVVRAWVHETDEGLHLTQVPYDIYGGSDDPPRETGTDLYVCWCKRPYPGCELGAGGRLR